MPPAKTESMTLQLAIPVISSMAPPMSMANVEVSPMEPGINPRNMSFRERGFPNISVSWSGPPEWVAACPRGVAPEKPSTIWPAPNPNVSLVRIKTSSPDIFDG